MSSDLGVLILVAANVVLHAVLLIALARITSDTNRTKSQRAAAGIFGLIILVVLVGNVQRVGLQLVALELVDPKTSTALTGWVQTTLSIAGTGFVLSVVVAGVWIRDSLAKWETLIAVMTDRPQFDVRVSDLGLTSRELEVLKAIHDGHLTNDELSRHLYISPATVSTHVTSLLKKAGVSSRRDLLILLTEFERVNRP